MGLNINDMAQSAYDIILNLQQQAVETVGLDTMYFRATPHKNGEDAVVFQEYTLYNVEDCGHVVRMVLSNADYQPGDYQVGLFGIDYQPIPEAQIPLTEWRAQYGENTQPQKGDIIYVQRLHKLYEVVSATVIYQIQSMPTAFKLSLGKYSPTASRRESDELRQTVSDMTVSQETLFGDVISQEVADTVAEVETSYQQTSYVAPQKTFDMGSVVTGELVGPNGNRISNAYYNMLIAEEPVVYKSAAEYDPACDRRHWIFTCWMRIDAGYAEKQKTYPVKSMNLVFKDNRYWYFLIDTTMRLEDGDRVTVSRGTTMALSGEVCIIPNCETKVVRIPLATVLQAEHRMAGWWKKLTFRIAPASHVCLLHSDNDTLDITVNPDKNTLSFRFGEFTKETTLKTVQDWTKWTYLALDLSDTSAFLLAEQLVEENYTVTMRNSLCEHITANVRKARAFAFDTLAIDAVRRPLHIRNIRLYENEYELTEETALMDAMSEVTRNASKLIVTDAPNIRTVADFYSPAR